MPQITLPVSLTPKDWIGKVTADVDKATKLSATIGAVSDAHSGLPQKLLDISDVKSPDEATQRAKDLDEKIGKKLDVPLQKLKGDLNKASGALKKAGKELPIKMLQAAIKSYEDSIDKAITDAKAELKTLADKLEKEAKAAAAKAKDAAPDPAAARDAAALKKKVLDHNARVKKAVRELRAGKVSSYPFVFGQNKTYQQYKKGMKPEDWKEKSLAHIGLKAVKTFRSALVKLMDTNDFELAFGEVTCKDGKKLVFNCESKLPKSKAFKEALLFQLAYTPPIQLRKGAEVLDEAGEGEDANEPIEDVPEDDDDAPKVTAKDVQTHFGKLATQIATAIGAGGPAAETIKKHATTVKGMLGNDAKAADAQALLGEIEKLLARPSAAGAAPAGVAPAPELEAALRDLATLRGRAVDGVTRVAGLIRKAYQGDPQLRKATEGADRIDKAKSLITNAVETQIAALLNEKNAAQRAEKARTLRNSVASYRKSIADHELLPDIDKSDFDRNLTVIAPYLAMLQRTEGLLAGLR